MLLMLRSVIRCVNVLEIRKRSYWLQVCLIMLLQWGGIANRTVLVDVISVDSAVVFVTATLITTSAVCA